MTWTAAIMPDDALPPNSLVKRILDEDDINRAPLANETGPFDPGEPPPPATVERVPLWRVMERAHEQEAGSMIDSLGNTVLGEPDRFTRAAEIEALQDRLLPEEPEPSPVDPDDGIPTAKWLRWHERQRLRALLTEQARIARGDYPSPSSSPSSPSGS